MGCKAPFPAEYKESEVNIHVTRPLEGRGVVKELVLLCKSKSSHHQKYPAHKYLIK